MIPTANISDLMMEKVEGSHKSMEDPQNSNNDPPWIELLDSLVEVIIEKLPLVDYIRFGIICKRWHSIQKEHRLRYSPNPSPTASSVFLVNYKYFWGGLNWENDKQLFFHRPFEQKKYRLPLPHLSSVYIFGSYRGWVLTHHKTFPSSLDNFNIYNPINGVMIKLPLLPDPRVENGSMSALPTDPNCCIIISTAYDMSVLELRDLVWKKVQVAPDFVSDNFDGFVYLKGKFYRTSSFTQSLYVVDPFLSKPIEQNLDFDIEEMIEYNEFDEKYKKLTVIDGELFLVIVVYHHYELIKKGFHVFKANFTTKEWVRVTSLGDYAMLLSDKGMCLPVHCVECFKKNVIYFTEKFTVDKQIDAGIVRFRVAWMTFDMDSQEIVEGPSFLYDKDEFDVNRTFMLFWFFPTL